MNLYLRVLWFFLATLFRPGITSVLETSIIKLRVLPNDLDSNMHMNNGRYLTIMDLGRLDLVMRGGLFKVMLRQKSVPILGAATIRYRLPLKLFQAYELHTRIATWDDKWAYMEQKFIIADNGPRHGSIAAYALVKGSFFNQKTKKMVPTPEVMRSVGLQVETPPVPAHIAEWQKTEELLRDVTRN